MPHKKKSPADVSGFELPKELIEQLIPRPMDAVGVEAVLRKLKKAVIERALGTDRRGRARCLRGWPVGVTASQGRPGLATRGLALCRSSRSR